MNKTYYWHIHHEMIAEPTNNIEERKDYVRNFKPIDEVETRLRLMVHVQDKVSVGKAWEDYNAIADKSWAEYKAAANKALEEYNASLYDLHKKEHPGCPWNGKTIFPEDVQ